LPAATDAGTTPNAWNVSRRSPSVGMSCEGRYGEAPAMLVGGAAPLVPTQRLKTGTPPRTAAPASISPRWSAAAERTRCLSYAGERRLSAAASCRVQTNEPRTLVRGIYRSPLYGLDLSAGRAALPPVEDVSSIRPNPTHQIFISLGITRGPRSSAASRPRCRPSGWRCERHRT
jgi:hypothetical protein